MVLPDVEAVPVIVVLVFDFDFLVVHFVRGDFKLHIATGSKINFRPFWQLQIEFFDERGHIWIGCDLTFPTLDTDRIFRDPDFEILLDGNLT